jgi:hypothetical protein
MGIGIEAPLPLREKLRLVEKRAKTGDPPSPKTLRLQHPGKAESRKN